MLYRRLRIWALYGFDAVSSGGAVWRVCGLVCLLVLLGIARFGWPLPLSSTPNNTLDSPQDSTNPQKDGVWERDNPIPLPERGRDKAGIFDRIKMNLRDKERQENDNDFQLLLACAKGDKQMVENLLQKGANPTYRNQYAGGCWETPLMAAAASGKADIVQLILDQPGVDPLVEDRDYQTAWTYATTNEIRQILKKRGTHR